MALTRKDKHFSLRGCLSCVKAGPGAVFSALIGRPVGVWMTGVMVIVILTASLLLGLNATRASAAEEPGPLTECSDCHTVKLVGHDKLGTGDEACLECHNLSDLTLIHAGEEAPLTRLEVPELCGQCHQQRFNSFLEGTHGLPGPGSETCTDCHNPHRPQYALIGITRPHPGAQPASGPPSTELFIILGISLFFIIVIGVMLSRKGENV